MSRTELQNYGEFTVGGIVEGEDGCGNTFKATIIYIYEEYGGIKVDVRRHDGEAGSGRPYKGIDTWTTLQWENGERVTDITESYNLGQKYKIHTYNGQEYI